MPTARLSNDIVVKWAIFFVVLVATLTTHPLALHIRTCDLPLGLESGDIQDDALTASSSYVPNVGPKNGRLNVERAGGAWCPKQQVEKGVREYLQIDLNDFTVVTGVQTQGRYDHGRGQEYTEEYTVEYWRPNFTHWKEYKRWDGKQIFTGNSDTATVVTHRLMPPVYATSVRILPYSIHRRTVCLRVEIQGCPDESGVINYQIPEPSADHKDSSYDGELINGILTHGLGRLVDGEYGADNFKLDIGYGKGSGWVAWKNDSFPKRYIEMLFEFDQVRNFTQVNIHSNNFFQRDVQVFARAKFFFSIGGKYFNGRPLIYNYMPDRFLENARNVTIHLHERNAKFVKIQLYFANKWIMISEVTFESEPIGLNVTEEQEEMVHEEAYVVNPEVKVHLDSYETVPAQKEDDGFIEILIGILTAIVLLLMLAFVIVLLLSRRQKLQGSPTILKNPFGVTINMKDLIMNLSPTTHTSNQPTPISQEAPSDERSPDRTFESFEQYRSPLMDHHSKTNYSTLKQASDVEEPTETTHCLAVTTPTPTPPPSNPVSAISTPLHYRNGGSAVTISRTKGVNATYFPKTNPESPNKKRYHTAPREKHRVPPPLVCWNIVPSMNKSYVCREPELVPIPRYCLRLVEQVGPAHSGEMSLFETEGLDDIIAGVGKLVLVRVPNLERYKNDIAMGSMESLREVRFLASLSDTNISRVLGVCTAEQPPWIVMEYGEMGDLAHYLQYSIPKMSTTLRSSSNLKSISYGCLIFMATQIASGMRYLETKHVCHKDLAARNCLVSRCYQIKIADVACCSPLYRKDYSEIGNRPPAPIRWLPWESILLDRYTCSSSVWSFGVTLWEILSLAREKPFQHLTNDEVVQNAEHMYYGGELQILLPKPTMCPTELYDLMNECWRRDETARPSFKQILGFLKSHNEGYNPGD